MVNLINMPVSREIMEKYQNRHTRQVEHATKQWEARVNKVANNVNRRQWIERQNNALTTETSMIESEASLPTLYYHLEAYND